MLNRRRFLAAAAAAAIAPALPAEACPYTAAPSLPTLPVARPDPWLDYPLALYRDEPERDVLPEGFRVFRNYLIDDAYGFRPCAQIVFRGAWVGGVELIQPVTNLQFSGEYLREAVEGYHSEIGFAAYVVYES